VIQPEPPGLMLAMVSNGPTQMVSGNIFEGLLRYTPETGAAARPRRKLDRLSEDAKTYTFKLKPGVTWHDGKPFTSADVLFLDRDAETDPSARPQQHGAGRQDRGTGRPDRRVHAEAAVRAVPGHLRGRFAADGSEASL